MADFDPLTILTERFRDAIARAFPDLSGPADPLISLSKQPKLGDYQSNAAMPLAKRLGMKPRDAADAIVGCLDIADIADEPIIAGPGFINVRLRADTLGDLLTHLDTPDLGVERAQPPQTIVVDLCSVNLAKQMHVGHLRSTIIGDALVRVFTRLGHRVIRQNHVGDWGLPIAMVCAKLRAEADASRIDLGRVTLDDLDRLYRDAKADCAADHKGLEAVRRFDLGPKAEAELEEQVAGAEEALAQAKGLLIKLQHHDPATIALWQKLADVTMGACLDACRRLRTTITAEDSAGESSYAEQLAPMVDDLVARGVAEESEGALVIRGEGVDEPCLIRKSDGGFLYATTDLAGIKRRVLEMGADRIVYCVDARQILHFRQVFAAAIKASFATKPGASEPVRLEHASFGSVLGEDGRPFKTRSGENVRLTDLLDEAEQRAAETVAQKNPDLPGDERRVIAEAVAVAAIKYADLSTDRIKDYVFSFSRMLAFEGDTGPYLLYALVRLRSIFRKAAERGVGGWADAPLRVVQPEEKSLALVLLRYPAAIGAVAETLEPHRLCQYLYELAGAFSAFHKSCHVLGADDEPTRAARLRLCDLTARVLTDGLEALGIPTLDRM